MSKYIFTARKILEDGSEKTYFFDAEQTMTELECNGFCLIAFEHSGIPSMPPESSDTIMEDVNIAMLASVIHRDEHLNISAKLANTLDLFHPKKEDK